MVAVGAIAETSTEEATLCSSTAMDCPWGKTRDGELRMESSVGVHDIVLADFRNCDRLESAKFLEIDLSSFRRIVVVVEMARLQRWV